MEPLVMMKEGGFVLMESAVLLDVMVSLVVTQRRTSVECVVVMALAVILSLVSSKIKTSRWVTMTCL